MISINFVLAVSLMAQISGEPQVRFSLDLGHFGLMNHQVPGYLDIVGVSEDGKTLHFVGSREHYEELQRVGHQLEILEVQPGRLDQRYHRPEEVAEKLLSLAEERSDIVELHEIGKSLHDRPVFAVRLVSPNNKGPKPAILFNAMHHAREVMTTEVVMDILDTLVRNYGHPDYPQIENWIDYLDIWLIPQVNPDGNFIVWEQDTWWRKNGRGDDSQTWGVDLNRNYPYRWSDCNGSSGDRYSQTYRGDSPGSEPETNNIMDLFKKMNFAISISFHSYSELVLPPYGCHGQYSPEQFIIDELGSQYASLLKKDSGQGHYKYGTSWEELYSVDGDDTSWMHHEFNTAAYVVELNSSRQGFQPDYDKWRDSTVLRQRAGWSFLLNRLLTGPQARGRIIDAQTGSPIDAEIRIEGVQYTTEKARKAKGGYYVKLLNPDSYTLIFSAPGYEDELVSVSIDGGHVDLDVYMNPSLNLGL